MGATATMAIQQQASSLLAGEARGDGATRSRGVRARAVISAVLSFSLCAGVVISSHAVETSLGAPVHWTWFLTGLQVTALWAAGSGRCWGWSLGAAVQPAWIVYAILTGQVGFVPGCLVSGAVQVSNAVRCVEDSPHGSF